MVTPDQMHPDPRDWPWLDALGAFDATDWIELLATAQDGPAFGRRVAWFLWDLARATTQHQLTTGTYPGQGKRPPTPLPPCTCTYRPYSWDSPTTGSAFTIDVMCPHHGANIVRYSRELGLTMQRWQVELYEASIRNGLPIQFATKRGRRW